MDGWVNFICQNIFQLMGLIQLPMGERPCKLKKKLKSLHQMCKEFWWFGIPFNFLCNHQNCLSSAENRIWNFTEFCKKWNSTFLVRLSAPVWKIGLGWAKNVGLGYLWIIMKMSWLLGRDRLDEPGLAGPKVVCVDVRWVEFAFSWAARFRLAKVRLEMGWAWVRARLSLPWARMNVDWVNVTKAALYEKQL